jgi:hypothetical protein
MSDHTHERNSVDHDFITQEEAAELLGVSVGQLAQMRYKGTGPVFYKPNSRMVRYKRSVCIAWLEANAFTATHKPVAAHA